MKKIFLTMTAALLLAACGTPKIEVPAVNVDSLKAKAVSVIDTAKVAVVKAVGTTGVTGAVAKAVEVIVPKK
jgi:uncharacterized lipoprotein YmbA